MDNLHPMVKMSVTNYKIGQPCGSSLSPQGSKLDQLTDTCKAIYPLSSKRGGGGGGGESFKFYLLWDIQMSTASSTLCRKVSSEVNKTRS